MDNRLGLIAMEGMAVFGLLREISLDEVLHHHMIASYNWVGSNWNKQFEYNNQFATTLNSFKYMLSIVEEKEFIPVLIEDENKVESNEDGLQHLIANVESYKNREITLSEMIDAHIKICATELNDYKEYFKDGWRLDLYATILRYVIQATNKYGDKEKREEAMSRLKIDLGIEECNFTIVQVK